MSLSIIRLPDTLVRRWRPQGDGLAAAATVARAYLQVVHHGRWRDARLAESSAFCPADNCWHIVASHPLLIDKADVCLFLTPEELTALMQLLGNIGSSYDH